MQVPFKVCPPGAGGNNIDNLCLAVKVTFLLMNDGNQSMASTLRLATNCRSLYSGMLGNPHLGYAP